MAEAKESKPSGNVEALLSRVSEFEKTVSTLLDNIKVFKNRLVDNMKKYGADMAKWPQEIGKK